MFVCLIACLFVSFFLSFFLSFFRSFFLSFFRSFFLSFFLSFSFRRYSMRNHPEAFMFFGRYILRNLEPYLQNSQGCSSRLAMTTPIHILILRSNHRGFNTNRSTDCLESITRWAPTSYKWSYKWPYKQVTGDRTKGGPTTPYYRSCFTPIKPIFSACLYRGHLDVPGS